MNLQGHATTPDDLEIITGTAADIDVFVDYVDSDQPASATTMNPGAAHVLITTATTTVITTAPTSGTKIRGVTYLNVRNRDTTDSCQVTIQIDRNSVGSDVVQKHSVNLAPGDVLEWSNELGWYKPIASTAANVYNQAIAAQGAGFATDTYVTGSNLLVGGRLKVGSRMQWRIHMSKTAASTAVPQGIIRFGTAGAIGDTARITFTGWPAQTAVVDEGALLIEAIVRTAGSSGIVQGNSALQHSAAVAAGFGEMFDAITSSAFDLTVSGLQAGISLNGSTSAAWTITAVQAQAENLA